MHRVVVVAVAVLAAACATTSSIVDATPPPPVELNVDVTLLPDEGGAASGVALRYCLTTTTTTTTSTTSTTTTTSTMTTAAWPKRLAAQDRRALRYIVSAADDDGRALPVDGEGVVTRGLAAAQCARVVVDVGRLTDGINDRDVSLRAGDDIITTPDLWLLRPEPPSPSTRMFIAIASDAGLQAFVPWPVDDDAAHAGRYIVDGRTFLMKSETVFGTFHVDPIDVAGARFDVVRLGDADTPPLPPKFVPWLTSAAGAVAGVLGRYPLRHVNVLVVPSHEQQPIARGFFTRGGGATASFYCGKDAGADDNDLDATGRWALTHELSHPLLPPVRTDDPWLNEGLATWYQDLLDRRAGLLVDDDAYWRELKRGLAAGLSRAQKDGLSLADASATMYASGAFEHAYLGGVGVMLLAEVQAQRAGASLDDVVRALRTKFPDDDRPRSAAELLEPLASSTSTDASARKAAAAARALLRVWDEEKARPFPATDDVLKQLGVTFDSLGGVHLDDNAPLAPIRKRITAPQTAPQTLESSS